MAKWMISKKATKVLIKKAAAVFFLLLASIQCGHAAIFQIIYIEAGEGNSSGGHLAIQLGQTIFHYQYDNGMVRLFKDNADNFRADYQYRQNRSLHSAEVDVSAETLEQLKNHFNLRFFSQKQQLKLMQSLQRDQFLLQTLLDLKAVKRTRTSSMQGQPLLLAGAGLFYRDKEPGIPRPSNECDTFAAGARIMAELKGMVSLKYGENFLPGKFSALKKQISGLSPSASKLDVPSYQYSFSEHYSDLLTGLLALNVLQNGHPLTVNACFRIDDPKLNLNDIEAKQAELFKDKLFKTAQSLLSSNRPDWGYALFITLARLIVLEDSIHNNHWAFLVDDDDDANEIPMPQVALYEKSMQDERRADLERLYRKARWAKADPQAYEKDYVELELAANRYHHWIESDMTGRLKYRSEQPLPQQNIPATRFLMTDLSIEQLQAAMTERKSSETDLVKNDAERNTYNIISNNCVTKLFSLVDEAVNGRSKETLGGYIDPQINFIPFRAFDTVQNTYRVKKITHLPAYREERLASLYKQESASLVYLRESNIFSSSLYNYNPDDAWFIFFTDDEILLRPLFGAFNIAAATSQSLFGLLSWPLDGGKEIKTGLRGIMASLPELALFNIRKGSYPFSLKN